MIKENDGLVIDIIDDEDEIVASETVGKAPRQTRADVSGSLDDLKKKLDAERLRVSELARARADAEKAANEARNDAKKARDEANSHRYGAVLNGLNAAKEREETLRNQLEKALEEGNYKAAAEYQSKIAQTAAELVKYEESKLDIEHRTNEAKEASKIEEKKPAQTSDERFETYVGQFSPKAQAWLRSHPETVTDAAMNYEMLAADARARKQGLAFESPEYFKFLESRLGFDKEDDDVEDERPTRTAMASAPVTRGAPVPDGKRIVRLTRAEAEFAQTIGMTTEEYWKYKQQAIKEGRYENP